MLSKSVSKILLSNIVNFKKLPVRQSALFINGPQASETFVYVNPYVDMEWKNNKDNINNCLKRRNSNIDLDKLENLWTVYQDLKQRKSKFDVRKSELSKEYAKCMQSDPNSDDIKKIKVQIDLIKDNIRNIKGPFWSAECNAIVELLKLPNTLHPLTPDKQNIFFTYLTQTTMNQKDHLQVGQDLDLISFKKNENYYLKGDAALFELGAKFYFSDILKQNNFIQFSNPDFVKSVIVEGCGEDHTDPDKTFILHHNEDSKVHIDSRLHLTGGGSLSSFMAYHAKNVIHAKHLPLKYFAIGRQYIPAPSEEDSLFHVSQSSVIQTFIALNSPAEVDIYLEQFVNILKDAYSSLGYHFRMSYVAADQLYNRESLRISIEMFSVSLNSYVEIANISISGDYISKRLMLTYVDKKENKFPHIISGTILNVPKLLACILEQDKTFSLPQQFKVENWSV